MKTGWWSFELPGYRPYPEPGTYSLFSYERLPPIRETVDPDYHWLRSQPARERSLARDPCSGRTRPDLRQLVAIAAQLTVALPGPFTTFIASKHLQERIRSCTDCYLDVADYAVRTEGAVAGYLIHFLSDSQWCGHWYIHVDHRGQSFVVSSLEAYGFAALAPDASLAIDLATEEVWFCAPSFLEFLYRFWLENEIWFALALSERPRTAVERAYVDHYVTG
jgi:hypothetical protein